VIIIIHTRQNFVKNNAGENRSGSLSPTKIHVNIRLSRQVLISFESSLLEAARSFQKGGKMHYEKRDKQLFILRTVGVGNAAPCRCGISVYLLIKKNNYYQLRR